MNTQVSNAGRYATNRKNTIPAGVSGLLGLSCPAAIGRLVVSVSIDPVECHFVLWFPHIIRKILKKTPSFANLYTFVCVVFTIFRSWLASSVHPFPCCVKLKLGLRTITTTVSVFDSIFTLETTARFGALLFQFLVGRYCNGSTITQTFTASSVNSGHIINHQKPSKSLADEGFFCRFRHNVASSMFCQWRDSDCNPFPPRFYGMTG